MKEIFNSWSKDYKSVFGALKTGEQCTFKVFIPKTIAKETNPVMVIFRNGYKERFLSMQKISENDDGAVFATDYIPTLMGVHYYYFALMNNGMRFYIKRAGANIGVIGEGEMFQLTVYDESFNTPDFVKGGMYYQIFPDRFYNSNIQKENVPQDRVIRNTWGETPYYRPDCNGRVCNNDYFGGDLKGIIQKIDYIKSLGVTCIYLNPIFEAHENHRYNTADYMRVDPLLGTNEDFKELCEKAKEMGISIILDGVFNHTGADSRYFNKNNRYDSVGAYNSKSSEYYSWYSFIDYPDVYEAWWGIDTLPNVNEDNKNYSDFICGDCGVLRYWLSMGAAGFRLDVADELPDSFLDRLYRCVKGYSPDKIILGEVWEDASNKESYGVKRRYLLGQQLDSVMNYPFKDAIISYMKGGSAQTFKDWIMTILENYPKPSIDGLMNFLSTHDILRAITNFGGDSAEGKSKDWQAEHYLTAEQYNHSKSIFKCAMVLQFFLPGVPCVYYGDEAGLQGYGDPFNRRCYPWGNEDTDLIEYARYLSALRKELSEYILGKCEFVCCNDCIVSFLRYNKDEDKCVLIAMNKSNEYYDLKLFETILSDAKHIKTYQGNLHDKSASICPKNFLVAEFEI